eukprot:10039912-Karenia_brevis.AAC.1
MLTSVASPSSRSPFTPEFGVSLSFKSEVAEAIASNVDYYTRLLEVGMSMLNELCEFHVPLIQNLSEAKLHHFTRAAMQYLLPVGTG